MVYIDISILSATPYYKRADIAWLCTNAMLKNHSKASNADDKVLSNNTSGVDSDIGIAPLVPGAGKKCFASCFC